MTIRQLRPPFPWIGGKYYSAAQIVAAFPSQEGYDIYVDLFGGAANILLQKPVYKKHVEVYNDVSSDLVNFWLQCRDHADLLEERLRSLPYSREVYYHYHHDLYADGPLDPLERAVRWFYVLRSSFTGWERASSAPGWSAGIRSVGASEPHAYHTALDLFAPLQRRMRHVLIDHRDFAAVFASYNRLRVLFYCDPPYIGTEHYYQNAFKEEDHVRLATLLNASPAYVALSYYPHPLLDSLYPASKWRRITWDVVKHSQRMQDDRERATEMLLCNYAPAMASLWEENAQQNE
ncbi:MAG: DNA adenine methylase [Ktedonobacteraceae bacterium]|nr:DNA adenine methylase [Ktedonobacteraceae bacterium]